MSEAKHTAGPWYTRHGQISSLTSSHGCTIANVNRTSAGISDEEIEANARLIAAAPDLLEALHGALFFVPLGTNAYERANAAIRKAKAEGR